MQDAFAGLILMDFATGMIFDFITTGKKMGAIYERLLIPGVTDEKTAFTYLVEAPFSGIRTRPEMMHHYMVRIDAQKKRAEWIVDGKEFFKSESLPVAPKDILVGWDSSHSSLLTQRMEACQSTVRARPASGRTSDTRSPEEARSS